MLYFLLFSIIVIAFCGYVIKECHTSDNPTDKKATAISAFVIFIIIIILKVVLTS